MQSSVQTLLDEAEASGLFGRVEGSVFRSTERSDYPIFHVSVDRSARMERLTSDGKQYDSYPELTAVIFRREKKATWDDLEDTVKAFLKHLAGADGKFAIDDTRNYRTYPAQVDTYAERAAEIPLTTYETFDVTS